MELDELTLAIFEPLVGDRFAVTRGDATIELVLDSAAGLGPGPGGRDPFSLVFRGPREPLLVQAIYRLRHGDLGALEIFVVPVGQDAAGTSYEAIFT